MLLYFRRNNFSPLIKAFSGASCHLRGNPIYSQLRGRAVVPVPVWHWCAAGKTPLLGRAWRRPAQLPDFPSPPPPILLSPVFPCGPSSREWEYFNGKCYYFSLTRMSWYKAKAQCEEMHSQLAIINSYAKQVKTSARGRKAQACPNPAHSPGFLQTPPSPPPSISLVPCCHPARPNLAGQLRAGAVILCINQQRAGRTCSACPLPASSTRLLYVRDA